MQCPLCQREGTYNGVYCTGCGYTNNGVDRDYISRLKKGMMWIIAKIYQIRWF